MKSQSIKLQVAENSIWNFLMMFFTKVGGLLFVIILARILLPEKYGLYSLATSIALLILSITGGGTILTLSRYVSEALKNKDYKKAAAYYKFLSKTELIFSGISALALLILAYPISFFIFKKPDLFYPLILASFYLFVLYYQSFHEFLFFTIKKVKYLFVKEAILQMIKLLLVLLLPILIISKYQVSASIAILLISSFIALLFVMALLRKKMGYLFNQPEEKIDKLKIRTFLKQLIFSDISTTILGYTDMIIIGIFLAPEYAGYYFAAFTIVGGLYAFLSISNLLLPVFTQMKKNQLSEAFSLIFRYTSIISIPIIFGTFILGKYVLRIVYGYEYLPAALPLFFLSILIFEFPLTSSLKSLFFARDKAKPTIKLTIYATIISLILNITLFFFLSKISAIWAVTGIAIGTVLSRMFIFLGLTFIARKELKLFYRFSSVIKPLISALLMAIILALINLNISNMTLLLGISEIIFGAIIYFVLLLLMKGIKKEDYFLFHLIRSKFR
ncbi:oligosaccharide flippase family protein [Candidatus Pacearchaeota archaeon]|nr:oligosaccharide flippase family protein [Candidatus Pacearchaeota archaeon]